MPALLMTLIVAAYGWQVHGVWGGVGAGFAFVLMMLAVTAYFLKAATEAGDVLALVRRTSRLRWGALIITMLAIGLSAAESCSPSLGCRSLWWG